MTQPLVVEIVRSGFVESEHLIDVAVVDRSGALIASAGDPARAAAFRSSAKPIQARASIEAGWAPPDDASLAIACASHNGEAAHVAQARAVLAAAGLDDGALLCPWDIPAFVPAMLTAREKTRIFHNCSGKHAAMLAACVAAGWPLEDYRDRAHPLQQRALALIDTLTGGTADVLVDGCGVPTPVAPLVAFARAFLAIDDGGPETRAMRAHPFLVGGSERFDTDLMKVAPALVTKAGAEGLACVSDGSVGIALKARDGDVRGRARGPAVVHVARALGLLDDETARALADHAEKPVLGGGVLVGAARVRGSLERA